MRAFRPWPIVAGFLVDAVGSIVVGFVYFILKIGITVAEGENPGEIVLSTTDYVMSTVFGLVFVVVGGYIAGRMAGIRPTMHGMCVGVAGLVAGILLGLVPDPQAPTWFNVVSLITVVPMAGLGGYLANGRVQADIRLQPTSGANAGS